MGGSSNPIKKVGKKISKQVKRTKAEDALSLGLKPAFRKTKEKTGLKLDFLAYTNPITAGAMLAAEAGEKFIDKPKAEKEEFKRQSAAADAAQKQQVAEIKARKKQEGAEKDAAEALVKSRARQRRRSKGYGRGSTILTDQLGAVGGEENQGRKSLLGL